MSRTPVQDAVTAYFDISLALICGMTRRPDIVCARHTAFYLEREIAGRSFAEIGKLYNRDHSSIVMSYRHMMERLAVNDERYIGPVAAISLAVKQKAELKAAIPIESLSCPTCGAPIVRELQRQIALLHERINELSRKEVQ